MFVYEYESKTVRLLLLKSQKHPGVCGFKSGNLIFAVHNQFDHVNESIAKVDAEAVVDNISIVLLINHNRRDILQCKINVEILQLFFSKKTGLFS